MTQSYETYNILRTQYLDHNLRDVIKLSLKMVRPRPKIGIIEWAEKNIYLRDPIPGPFRLKNSPHLREIFEAIDDPTVRKITIMASSQVGKTLLMIIIWAYFADVDPSGMLIMHPTDREVQTFVDTKLDPVIEDSPLLRNKIGKSRRGDVKSSTTRRKFFPGGWTEIISGTSRGTTRQRTIKRSMADDIDAIEFNTASEGDHTANLEKRTTTFKYDYLNINISTPLLQQSSRILKKYDLGSMGVFHIQCPDCHQWFVPDDDKLHWEKETDIFGKVTKHNEKTAVLVCSCGSIIDEPRRLSLLQTAKFIHKHPERKVHRSFQINQYGSSLSSLENCCLEKIQSLNDPENLESYTNTVRGLPYSRKQGEEIDPMQLMEQIEDFINPDNPEVPNDTLLITASVDVQRGSKEKPARLEVEVWGWGMGEEGWLLHKFVIPGNPIQREVWAKLDLFWEESRWIRKDKVELYINRIFIDSGDLSPSVYDYVQGKTAKGILAIKGANQYGAPLLPRNYSRVGKDGRVLLISIGTQAAKSEIYNRLELRKASGPKKLHFPRAYCNAEYFKQLTAEVLVKKTTGYVDYFVYEKKDKKSANESLDLLVYAYCAMKHCTPNFTALKYKLDERARELSGIKEENKTTVPAEPAQTNAWGRPAASGWGK